MTESQREIRRKKRVIEYAEGGCVDTAAPVGREVSLHHWVVVDVPVLFVAARDDSHTVGDDVRNVGDAALAQGARVSLIIDERVVGGSTYDRRAQVGDGLGTEHAA